MIINHNIPALNAVRQNQANNLALNKSIAKLSSGLRINSAADDAAGLAISEKMRGQIRGTEQAYRNSQDGISLLNTADGGMSGIQDVLHRMRELSIQAANDTATDDDRQKIQTEINSLRNEINSIANDTEFNTIKLLCASGASGVQSTTWSVPPNLSSETYVFTIDLSNNTVTSTAIQNLPSSQALNNIAGVCLNYSNGTQVWASILFDSSPGFMSTYPAINSLGPPNGSFPSSMGSANDTFMTWQFEVIPGSGVIVDFSDVESVTFYEVTHSPPFDFAITIPIIKEKDPLIIHVGANTDQQLLLPLPVDMRTDALGLTNGEPIVTSQSAADNSIRLVDSAIAKVATERAKVGALQNRLEYTMENLGNYSENISAAESRLRDLSISDQIKELSKQKVLLEASQAMIAQANNLSQNVLTLLK